MGTKEKRPQSAPEGLAAPVAAVRGVGPKIARAFEKRGIRTVGDLFYFIPARYEDRRQIRDIRAVVEGEENVILARVVEGGISLLRRGRRRVCRATVDDGTGRIGLAWFRFQKGIAATVSKRGTLLLLAGKVTRYGAGLQMVHPRLTVVGEEEEPEALKMLLPVYPEIEGTAQGVLRRVVREALGLFGSAIQSVMPERLEAAHGLCPLAKAVRECHFPGDGPRPGDGRDPAVTRLILEEFFLFQSALLLRRRAAGKGKGIALRPGGLYRGLVASLPFALTGGQARVLAEIGRDMARPEPMNRLVQGEVGCGKTVCAVAAACIAVDSGSQVAFMAPTEILAEQHYLTVHRLLERAGVRPVLLRGKMGRERAALLKKIAGGEIKVVVGTHALVQEQVAFHRLGLVVVDEQHRFGVIQRSALREKGGNPDVLVMSATPIPRTLSMVVYGDLDVSLIDEVPPRRGKVSTEVVTDEERRKVYGAMRDEIGKGRQAFVVYPILKESDRLGLVGAKESLGRLRKTFPSFRVGLLHGKMKAEEKEEVMLAFREARLDVLVCTTVIEVGIDVPNASLMVVEHAERFGLSQLHQLRGRVGRGSAPSRCLLVSGAESGSDAAKRLRVLERTSDGFAVAEEDMLLRGPGDMLGVRQAGVPAFRIGSIVRDGDLMGQARRIALEALASAGAAELARLEAAAEARWGTALRLGDVG